MAAEPQVQPAKMQRQKRQYSAGSHRAKKVFPDSKRAAPKNGRQCEGCGRCELLCPGRRNSGIGGRKWLWQKHSRALDYSPV